MNILIIKIGDLREVLRTSFIAQALVDKYKEKTPKIYWLANSETKSIFINNSYIYRVIVETEIDFLQTIKWDLIVNLECNEDICNVVLSLKKKEILGFHYKDQKIVLTHPTKEWSNIFQIERNQKNFVLEKKSQKTYRQILLEAIGIQNWQKYKPFLRLTEDQRKFASDFMKKHNLLREELIIGINTRARLDSEQMSVKKTTELINELYKKFKPKIILFGESSGINKEIIRKSKAPIIEAIHENDFVKFSTLVSVCSIFITTVNLGLEVSLALKRKTICLIGPSSPSKIEMYDIGEKVIAKSKCVGCYKKNCKSIEKIDIKEVLDSVKKLTNQKIILVITAFKEPNISRAIESAINQKTKFSYDILVSAPDEETIKIAKEYQKNHKNLEIIKDPGKGKSFALNLIFKEKDSDILILTDGDVYISDNSVEEICNSFFDQEIGCITGRPVPIEDRTTKYGYWANFLFEAAHIMRKNAFIKNSFIECSGYLFAFRKQIIKKIPLDVAEDAIIPYLFWEEGYSIGYAENAKVFVKNPDSWKDWIKQKVRTSKGHETLEKYVNTFVTKRLKSFRNEVKGLGLLFSYPRNIKEIWWGAELVLARFYMWVKVFLDTKIRKEHYKDAWERIESTK